MRIGVIRGATWATTKTCTTTGIDDSRHKVPSSFPPINPRIWFRSRRARVCVNWFRDCCSLCWRQILLPILLYRRRVYEHRNYAYDTKCTLILQKFLKISLMSWYRRVHPWRSCNADVIWIAGRLVCTFITHHAPVVFGLLSNICIWLDSKIAVSFNGLNTGRSTIPRRAASLVVSGNARSKAHFHTAE